MKKNLLHIALASTLGLSALPAFSANDGTLGATSFGDVDLNLIIAAEIQITGLDNIPITRSVSGTTLSATGFDDFCVYSNAPTFSVTPSNSGTAFNLTGLLGDTIAYTVNFDGTTPVPYGDPSAALTPSTSFTCTALTDQTVTVNIDDAALQGKAADTYTDTLILTVTPL